MATGPTSPPLTPESSTFTQLQSDFENHKTPIPEHHSKTLGIN